ncbi:GNAT family N-acetyltransferase [Bacillus sp. PS06]|uniref:GNAT family N-acetyltransferase n=1 Tax=Bacillus sp. PS06 TaxID=2764176 RepID=UPI001784D288|nr:GNAT family N-acetyltransferase [Bacillus sp. PS06]MBD8067484.1 GNAT family N-acetyltransferase [Bacillus sp. PS06]
MEVLVVTNEQTLKDAYTVRHEVFVNEQQVPADIEIDEFENTSTHVVLYDKNHPVGAGRFRVIDGVGKAERICVLPSHRKLGAGRIIMKKIEEVAKENKLHKLKLNAQTHAEPFYLQLGYQTVSDVFMDAGIPHVTMTKEI